MEPTRKILGLVLLLAGLAVIFYGLYSSFNIYTAKAPAPEIFEAEKSSKTATDEVQAMIQEQLKGMLPAGSIVDMLNLASWSVFAGILIFGGAQVSSLGIKLIK
jgi:hypothetical protein